MSLGWPTGLRNSIHIHEGYWLADSQASIQSLYTSTASDRSEEQQIKDKKIFCCLKLRVYIDAEWQTLGKKYTEEERKCDCFAGKYPLLSWIGRLSQ